MAKWALLFGAALLALGLIGYFGGEESPTAKPASDAGVASAESTPQAEASDEKSSSSKKTALIPALFGVALLLCGTLGLDNRMRKHAMHAAAAVALLGALGAGGRVAMKFNDVLAGDISRAMSFVLIMTALCVVYVVMSILSFRNARRQREAGESSAS